MTLMCNVMKWNWESWTMANSPCVHMSIEKMKWKSRELSWDASLSVKGLSRMRMKGRRWLGVLASRCNLHISKTLPVSIRGEPVAYTARARRSSAFLWLLYSIESNKLLIPGGPWAVAIDKVSDLSFSPRIEVEGLLSDVGCCERWGNLELSCVSHKKRSLL